jgi:hypothetical protein
MTGGAFIAICAFFMKEGEAIYEIEEFRKSCLLGTFLGPHYGYIKR